MPSNIQSVTGQPEKCYQLIPSPKFLKIDILCFISDMIKLSVYNKHFYHQVETFDISFYTYKEIKLVKELNNWANHDDDSCSYSCFLDKDCSVAVTGMDSNCYFLRMDNTERFESETLHGYKTTIMHSMYLFRVLCV